jgi:hypothetical protein
VPDANVIEAGAEPGQREMAGRISSSTHRIRERGNAGAGNGAASVVGDDAANGAAIRRKLRLRLSMRKNVQYAQGTREHESSQSHGPTYRASSMRQVELAMSEDE